MRKLAIPFAFFVAFVASLAGAQTPFTGLVFPPHTVLGNPAAQSTFGQAIPFSTFAQSTLTSVCTTPNATLTYSATTGWGCVVPLPIASGGTNCTSASGTCIDNLSGFSSTGFLRRTGAGAYTVSTFPLQVTDGGTGCTAAAGTCLDNITGFSGTGFLKRVGGVYSFIADPLPLTNGGTAASLTASNGGLVYSTASAMAILSGTATAGQIPRSGSSAAPSWSTATYPATTTANRVLYSSANNTITDLATANGGVLNTSGAGVPSITAQPTLGVNGGTGGQVALNGATSGTVTVAPQAAAGTATFTLPNASGTPAISVPSPLSLSATTGAVTWSGLTSDGILFGSSATAVASNRCTMDTNQSIACTSASSALPTYTLTNSTADTASAFFLVQKNRAGGNTSSGDSLFQLVARGFANGAQQNAADILMAQDAASSGSVIPSKIQLFTTRAAAFDNNIAFDRFGHMRVTTTATPTLTAGCNGAGNSVTGNDVHGQVVGQTAAATSCTLTFANAYTAAPHCVMMGMSSPLTGAVGVSTTTLVVNFASTANYTWSYHCFGA